MKQFVYISGTAIRRNKILMVSKDNVDMPPSIKIFIEGTDTVFVAPYTNEKERDETYYKLMEALENDE